MAPHIYTQVYTCLHRYVNTCLHTCLWACLHTYLPTCLHTFSYSCARIDTHVDTDVDAKVRHVPIHVYKLWRCMVYTDASEIRKRRVDETVGRSLELVGLKSASSLSSIDAVFVSVFCRSPLSIANTCNNYQAYNGSHRWPCPSAWPANVPPSPSPSH